MNGCHSITTAAVTVAALALTAPVASAQERGPLALASMSYFFVGGRIDSAVEGSPTALKSAAPTASAEEASTVLMPAPERCPKLHSACARPLASVVAIAAEAGARRCSRPHRCR